MFNTPDIKTIRLAELLTDASIDRVVAIDTQWKIIAWNKNAETITGITKKEVFGKPLLDVFPALQQDEEMMRCYKFAFKGKKSFLESKPGLLNRAHYENHFIPLEENGTVTGVMNIMHDVAHRIKEETELLKLNAALNEKYVQLEKAIAELATFTAIIGTEFKEPIRNAYTALEFLATKEGRTLSLNGKTSLRRIQASLNRMNLLLDDILALSTAGSLSQQFTEVNLQQLLHEVLITLQPKLTKKMAVIQQANLPVLRGSRQMLHYLLQNIIDNILEFHAEGSIPQISITGKKVLQGNKTTEAQFKKEYYCIIFTDKAIGFVANDIEKIFSIFEQVHNYKKHSAPGFALAMCRKITEAHGGYIEAESQPGKGTSLNCYLDASI